MLGWLLALTLVVGDLWPGGADRVLTAVTTVTQSVTRFLPSQGEPGATATDSHAAEAEHHGWSASEPPHLLLVLSGALVVAGGLCIAYIERRAFEELTRQYSRMYVLFVHSIDALQLSPAARGRGCCPARAQRNRLRSTHRERELADSASGAPIRAAGTLRHSGGLASRRTALHPRPGASVRATSGRGQRCKRLDHFALQDQPLHTAPVTLAEGPF